MKLLKALGFALACGVLAIVVSRVIGEVGRTWLESGEPFPLVMFILLVLVALVLLGVSIFFLLRMALRQLNS